MKLAHRLFSLFFLFIAFAASAQNTGRITGVVRDKNTQEPIIGATVSLEQTTLGVATDAQGRYRLENVPTGNYNLKATYLGYEPITRYNIPVTSGNALTLNLDLAPSQTQLQAVDVTVDRSIRVATVETPLSVQSLSSEEIKSNPGGNFDISRVIQTLPGVAGAGSTGAGFRNDIVIRGGGPGENVFFLDGIEIPVINHFSTQGSSGGPQGILNVSFIEDVTLSTSAFDAKYDNALSSVFQFKQKEGNPDRLQGNVRLSATELAGTLEGPLAPKTTFLASARRSYLQLLFKAIDLPIRPNYWDFQYKVTHQLNDKTTLTALGIGAIDEFSFAVPKESSPEKEYALRSNPLINQWNYTVGASLKRSLDNGFVQVSISRNVFENRLDRFEDAQYGDETRRIFKSRSQEKENKLRVDVNQFNGGWKFSYGAMAQYVGYDNLFFSQLRPEVRDQNGTVLQPREVLDFNTNLNFWRYGVYGQASRSFLQDKLSLSLGVRSDMNSFTKEGRNPLETLSPRLSGSYALTERWKLNGSVGTYYRLPIYTVLGFQNAGGDYANKDSDYIRATHYVAGVEFLPGIANRITVEGFYKRYAHYPVSLRDGVSLANQGIEFGAIGNEAVASVGKGRAYGAEFFFQQKLTRGLYGLFSYTLVRSEFTGLNDENYVASAWDNRHLVSALLGWQFGKNWELGGKYRFAGGSPYTPFDLEASQQNYASLGTGLLDYDRLNSLRLRSFQQLDVRLDKKWNYKRTTLDVYVDIQNIFRFKGPSLPQYTFQRNADNTGFATTDGQPLQPNGSNAIPLILDEDDVTFLPSIGFVLEF
ncbi:TonB-dependent receptor plug domain-containing protein [Nibribacter ruber]|uniref:TonB-dependent receptor plug domain-containing protein n=1 Tax=Nibribacter ruber TaxID=2698458 RepID=A0A6P1NZ46_9BACT|nr:TonB-dependent receptor [Nibribacter ruber]QHL87375.1 TonB-dependent receptor plug domain-containing protein [Nibribacter ruber]